jgi:hypothetical protein
MIDSSAPTTRDTYTVLKDFGLPVALLLWGILAYLQQNRRKLSIRQVGTSVTDTVRPFGGERTAIMVELVITNDSPHATVVIAYFDLKLPWNEPELEPLPDPWDAWPRSEAYSVPGFATFEIPRDNVLNHRRYQYGKLAPGESIRGFFLATGVNSIPDDLRSVQERLRCIEGYFVIQDTTGKEYRSKQPIQLHY